MENIRFYDVEITDGFWKNRQDINRKVTIHCVKKHFEKTGRFKALKCEWKTEMPNKPHAFWDSDSAKWIESVAYLVKKGEEKELEKFVESLIDDIEKNQDETGYFNSYYLVAKDEKRFALRDQHELYCAGHFIEAAVAWYEATGKDRLLNIMKKYAAYIEKVFLIDQSAAYDTCGHEEIELALFRLYRCTKEERWLKLSEYFINRRGNSEKDLHCEQPDWMTYSYHQSLFPVRSQETARGHAVRACYLYSAMADLAFERKDDKDLLKACENLFNDIAHKKMYITGGVGSSYAGEAFTRPYDLPNSMAYAETCASIALAYFAMRMQKLTLNSEYADVVERALFNGILSGVSMKGDSFFYCNPLEINPALKDKDNSVKPHHRSWQPITQRVEMFGCSCCPPNLTRFIASIGDYIYSENDDTLYVNQYIPNCMNTDNKNVKITTEYPKNGKITINATGYNSLALRIPKWCKKFNLNKEYTMENGYATVKNTDGVLILDLEMTPILMQSSSLVTENIGRGAVQMGPLVYCLEELDNGGPVRELSVNKKFIPKVEYSDEFGANIIYADGYRVKENKDLYSEYKEENEAVELKFIPYFAFANRKETSMAVWNRVI